MKNPELVDSVRVIRNNDEIVVYNWCTVKRVSQVHGHGETETVVQRIEAGDGGLKPKYVTVWLSELLRREMDIRVQKYDIEVVDVSEHEII